MLRDFDRFQNYCISEITRLSPGMTIPGLQERYTDAENALGVERTRSIHEGKTWQKRIFRCTIVPFRLRQG